VDRERTSAWPRLSSTVASANTLPLPEPTSFWASFTVTETTDDFIVCGGGMLWEGRANDVQGLEGQLASTLLCARKAQKENEVCILGILPFISFKIYQKRKCWAFVSLRT